MDCKDSDDCPHRSRSRNSIEKKQRQNISDGLNVINQFIGTSYDKQGYMQPPTDNTKSLDKLLGNYTESEPTDLSKSKIGSSTETSQNILNRDESLGSIKRRGRSKSKSRESPTNSSRSIIRSNTVVKNDGKRSKSLVRSDSENNPRKHAVKKSRSNVTYQDEEDEGLTPQASSKPKFEVMRSVSSISHSDDALFKAVENANECINLATYDFANEINTTFTALVSHAMERLNFQKQVSGKYAAECTEKQYYQGSCKRYEALLNHMLSKLYNKQVERRYFNKWYVNYLRYKAPPVSVKTPHTGLTAHRGIRDQQVLQTRLDRSEMSSAVKNAILRGLAFLSNETLKVLGPVDKIDVFSATTSGVNPPRTEGLCGCDCNCSAPDNNMQTDSHLLQYPSIHSVFANLNAPTGELVQDFDNRKKVKCQCPSKCVCETNKPTRINVDGNCVTDCECGPSERQALTARSKESTVMFEDDIDHNEAPGHCRCLCDCVMTKSSSKQFKQLNNLYEKQTNNNCECVSCGFGNIPKNRSHHSQPPEIEEEDEEKDGSSWKLEETSKSSGYGTGRSAGTIIMRTDSNITDNSRKLSLRERCEKFKNEINEKIVEEFNLRKNDLDRLEQSYSKTGSMVQTTPKSDLSVVNASEITIASIPKLPSLSPRKSRFSFGSHKTFNSHREHEKDKDAIQIKINSARPYNELKSVYSSYQTKMKMLYVEPQPMNPKEVNPSLDKNGNKKICPKSIISTDKGETSICSCRGKRQLTDIDEKDSAEDSSSHYSYEPPLRSKCSNDALSTETR